MPSALMACAMPCVTMSVGWGASAAPRLRAATASLTPANIATRRWPSNCSGACSPTCKASNRASGTGRRFRRLTGRFKRVIHVGDSTTIQLIASYLDWAKHRRRKAAAKCPLRLDLHSLLPRFAIVDSDDARAREVCRRDRHLRPGLHGLRAPVRPARARRVLGHPHQEQPAVSRGKDACTGPRGISCTTTRWG